MLEKMESRQFHNWRLVFRRFSGAPIGFRLQLPTWLNPPLSVPVAVISNSAETRLLSAPNGHEAALGRICLVHEIRQLPALLKHPEIYKILELMPQVCAVSRRQRCQNAQHHIRFSLYYLQLSSFPLGACPPQNPNSHSKLELPLETRTPTRNSNSHSKLELPQSC